MKQAVILAAGEGKRLKPFTVNKPKVMLTVAGKPILSYVIDALVKNGIRSIILVVGYRQEQIYSYFGSGEEFGAEITYVTQEQQMGTAHALLQARNAVEDEFMVLPGDNLISLETLVDVVSAEPNSILVKKTENPVRYGVVSIEHGMVGEISEKPREAKSDIVSTGIYALNSKIFDFVSSELDIPDVLNSMLREGHSFKAVETMATWLDAVYPWDLLSLNAAILKELKGELGGTIERGVTIKPPVVIGKNTVIHSNSYIEGPVIIGDNCRVGPFVSISPSTSIGSNVVIQPFCHLSNSVIGPDVNVGPGSIIEDSVVDKGCDIKGRFTAISGLSDVKVDDEYHSVRVGAMLGEDCEIWANVTASPGLILGNLSHVSPLKLISGNLPDKSFIY